MFAPCVNDHDAGKSLITKRMMDYRCRLSSGVARKHVERKFAPKKAEEFTQMLRTAILSVSEDEGLSLLTRRIHGTF